MKTQIVLPLAFAITTLCFGAAAHAAQDAAPIGDAVTAAVSADAGAGPVADAGPEAPATAEPATAGEALDSLGELVQAVRSGHWRMVAGLSLSLLMFGFNWARKNVKWLKGKLAGDRAGALSLIALAVAGGLLTSLASDAPLDFKLIAGALWTAVEAAGIFLLIKKVFKPKPSDA